MNKDVIRELMDLKQYISTVKVTPYAMKPVINRLNIVIIDLMDEGRESETCCACEDCSAMKKVDELIEVTKLREWPEETASEAALESKKMIKKLMGASMTADEIIEAEKMARGGTD